jgi:hypothetical protein
MRASLNYWGTGDCYDVFYNVLAPRPANCWANYALDQMINILTSGVDVAAGSFLGKVCSSQVSVVLRLLMR